jgi:hypothetical protein
MGSDRYRLVRTVCVSATFSLAMAGCGLYPSLLAAAEVVNLAVGDKQGVYQLALEVIVDAPARDVHYVITDYIHIYRIDPSIVESDVVRTTDASRARVRTLVNDCVLSFCQEILRVEDVREVGEGDIYGKVVPGLSNVRSGTEHWQIRPIGDKTRINFHSTLEPGFFVPPFIGTHIVERKLQEEALTGFNNIERIAQIHHAMAKADTPALKNALARRIIREQGDAR